MKFLKKIFKKEKKYKIILTEDEMFILGPIILMWIEDWKEGLKKEDYSDYSKEIAERDIKIGWSMIIKIKKARGIFKEQKKWNRKNRKMLRECGLK